MATTNDMLLKMMEQLRADFSEEREASRQSRSKLHERVDGISEDIGAIRGDIRILGEVDGQVRGEIQNLKESVAANQASVQPTVDAWRDLLKSGRRISWAFSIAGITTVGGFLAAVTGLFDWVVGALKAKGWL